MFRADFTILATDVEEPYNHVHHASILKYLEQTRLLYMEAIGCPNQDFLANNLFLVISHISIDYKREVKVGKIQVTCEDVVISEKRVVITQHVYNERGKHAVAASVESQFLSGALGRSILPPEAFVSALQRSTTNPAGADSL